MITMAGIIIAAAGLFLIAGSLFNWDWYWDRHRTRVWVDLFGRTGARVAYGIVRLAVAVVGVLIAAGVIAV